MELIEREQPLKELTAAWRQVQAQGGIDGRTGVGNKAQGVAPGRLQAAKENEGHGRDNHKSR